jgi:hypothetical protein
MDLNKRDELHEAGERSFKNLKSAYKDMFNKQMKPLTESAKSPAEKVGDKLKKQQKVSLKEEAPLDDKPLDDKPADAVVPPAGDAAVPPVGADVPPAGDVPPPVVANAPEGGDLNSQDQLATRSFVGTFLKTLPSDIDLNAAVDANGVFKSSVNDQHDGQFVVVVYPATKNLHQVADLVEPVTPGTNGVAPAGSEVPAAGAVPAVDGGAAVPPALDAVVPPAGDAAVPPVEGEPVADVPPKEEELTEMEKEEAACAMKEKERDPMMEGRKNWKAQLNKLLNENVKPELKKEEKKEELKEEAGDELSKKEKALAHLEDQLKNATSEEDKADLRKDIGTVKMAISKIKGQAKDKADVQKLMGANKED